MFPKFIQEGLYSEGIHTGGVLTGFCDKKKTYTLFSTKNKFNFWSKTKLKQKPWQCNFIDVDREIKDQIVSNCHSDCLRRKTWRDDLNWQNLQAGARAIELSNKQTLIDKKDQQDLYRLQKPGKCSNKYDKDKSNKKETNNNRKCFPCRNLRPHRNGSSLCPAFGHHCKRYGKQNHLESKWKTQISQVNKIESFSDSDDSFIYTINHIYKVSSKNIIKLRINICDIDFQIDSGASVHVICRHDFNKSKIIELKTSNTKFFA